VDGEPVSVGGPRQRCVLGALLVDLGKEVTVDRLIDYLWDDDPPRTARSVIQVQVSHLRRAFPDVIETTAGGYLANVPPERIDLYRFRELVSRAQTAAEPTERVLLWERALACWRGKPFSGTGSDQLWYAVCQPLIEERWAAVTGWAECAFSLHRYSEIVTRLTPLLREDPLRERLQYLLIAALHRSGQRAAALTAFQDTRAYLAEELGVDPSPAVMELHQRILRDTGGGIDDMAVNTINSPQIDFPTGPQESPVKPDEIVPRNDLPRDIPDFTGREEALRQLLRDPGGDDQDRAEVHVITGPGGAGKTTLAVHAAHRLAEHHPDGQLFIDLYGYTVDQEPVSARSALGTLLRAIGVEPEAIPETVEERAALWRAMLAGKRVLVVLDNARNHAQVSPLLSAAAGSLTLVTTRHDLPGLSGARYISLGMLGEEASLRLFTTVLGAERVEREPEQARQVVRLCGGLPLALRIVVGRMLSRPRWTFAHVAQRLGEHQRRFRELRVDGQSVEAVFELSYQSLYDELRRGFLLLGMMVGSSADLHGAAALLGCDLPEADDLLQDLVSVCLLDEPGVDHYRFHDLIGAYARQKALQLIPSAEIETARRRMADHYLDMAQRAARMMGPRGHDYVVGSTDSSRYRNDFSTRVEAAAWFDRHQENLAATVDLYAAVGAGDEAWQLADSLWRFYALSARTELLLSTHERALAVSRAQGNERGSAVTLIGLGIAHCLAGRFEMSLKLLNEARDLLAEVDDRRGQVRVYGNLGMVYERMGRFHDAITSFWKVLDHAISVADPALEAMQRTNVALLYQVLGDYEKAIEFSESALRIDVGETHTEVRAQALRILGEVHAQLGDFDAGFRHLQEALDMGRVVGAHTNEIYTHNGLAVALRASGDLEGAIKAHLHALQLGEDARQHSADAEILADLGETYAAAGRHDEAAATLGRGLSLARERSERYIEARALLGLALLPEAVVDPATSLAHLTAAATIFAELGVPQAERAQTELHHRRTDG
jgi:DNA-binding SARP family transcriptional activator/tetratricopeptide (TPR) repeat protein